MRRKTKVETIKGRTVLTVGGTATRLSPEEAASLSAELIDAELRALRDEQERRTSCPR